MTVIIAISSLLIGNFYIVFFDLAFLLQFGVRIVNLKRVSIDMLTSILEPDRNNMVL